MVTSVEPKQTGCLGYIGDEILPSNVGILVIHETRFPIKQCHKGFFRDSQLGFFPTRLYQLQG